MKNGKKDNSFFWLNLVLLFQNQQFNYKQISKSIKMKKNKLLKWLPILIIPFTSTVFGQNSSESSLKECILYSLENHPNSSIYQNQKQIAKQQNTEALSVFLPQINATGGIDYNAKLQTTVIPAGGFSPQEIKIRMGNPHSNSINLQWDQKIYDQSAMIGLKAMKVSEKIADLNVLKSNENIMYNTALAYYQVQVLDEKIALLQDNQKQYTELLRIMQLQLEKGVIKQTDFDRTKVTVNNIQAQLSIANNNKKLALNRLKQAMGMPLESNLQIQASNFNEEEIQLELESKADISNRFDIQINKENLFLQQMDLRSKKAAYLPTISGYARYGALSYSQSFNTSFDTWYDYSTIGLKLNVPIFSGLRKYSQVKQSQLKLQNVALQNKLVETQYQLEYQNAYTQMLSSFSDLKQNKLNLELAKSVYENVNLQYQEGQSSLSDFLNSDMSYKEAQSNYTNALLNFLSARLDVEKTKGTLANYIQNLK